MNSPPTTLGQYQIIREIARSNDIVYEAYDPLMNRRVAVKELAMPQGVTPQQQEERINRFKREAQAAGTLSHPNIMTVFQIAEDNGRTYMAMEFLDGCTLRNEIDSKGFLPVDRAIEIASKILEGLSHAHSKGVIHRDIKPDNIQLLSNGTIKITDFGIARLIFQPNLTMDGQVFGTPSYMSPEQVVGKDIDARSDLFSVGVVLYEMIAGQKPFPGDSVVAITYAIMNAQPSQPSQVDYALWQVIGKALEKTPQMRYANAEDMIKALKDSQMPAAQGQTMSAMSPSAYGANPYMTPQPSAVAPPPIYAYNPYQAPAAPPPSPYQTTPYQANPYQANPYQANPYQNTAYPSQYNAYQAGPSMMAPGGTPIYYPPPPRSPMMSAETAAFLKKLVIVCIIMGTLIMLILVGLNAISAGINNAKLDNQDRSLPASVANLPENMPISEKIERYNAELNTPHSVGMQAELKHELAHLYEQSGTAAFGVANLELAEDSFQRAVNVEQNNPQLWSELATVFAQASSREPSDPRLAMNAGDDWCNASRLEQDSTKRGTYNKEASEMYLKYAGAVADGGDSSQFAGARDRLNQAKQLSGQDQDAKDAIDAMLQRLDKLR